MVVDVPGTLRIIGPPANHIGMEGDDVNGIRSAAISGYVVDEFLCCELVLEGHGNIQVELIKHISRHSGGSNTIDIVAFHTNMIGWWANDPRFPRYI